MVQQATNQGAGWQRHVKCFEDRLMMTNAAVTCCCRQAAAPCGPAALAALLQKQLTQVCVGSPMGSQSSKKWQAGRPTCFDHPTWFKENVICCCQRQLTQLLVAARNKQA
jgi:hypothetical protein